MIKLLPETRNLVTQLENLSDRSIEFMRDDSLPVLASIKIARNGASYHILQYKPSNNSLDYYIAQQVGIALRMYEQPENKRFDFASDNSGEKDLEAIIKAAANLSSEDMQLLPMFTKSIYQWALMQLRSIPIGMRVDAWLFESFPNMREAVRSGLAEQQQMNAGILGRHIGGLMPPLNQFAPAAAYALFTDRLLGTSYVIPFKAAGSSGDGKLLLDIFDQIDSSSAYDVQLVNAWAKHLGMENWYQWIPYQP
ncbi:MAG: hypothetical protein Q7U77_03875 [Sediminibacterium sp.]|nr:hypothetical protein [Sediminibacterium sp.]MDO8995738.1 hypothetical protein [Sediminibacterium sp.]